MTKGSEVLAATILAFSALAAAQAEDVITLYAPSLRPAPTGQPLKDVNGLDEVGALNDIVHFGGEIDSISAIGLGYDQGRWYVGVQKYSVVVSRTASQLTTVTLPTPTSKTGKPYTCTLSSQLCCEYSIDHKHHTVTFYASPTNLIYIDVVDLKLIDDKVLSGKLTVECGHDVKGNVPPNEGIVICDKTYQNASDSLTAGEIWSAVRATTIGHAIPLATITVTPSMSLPTLVEAFGGGLSTYSIQEATAEGEDSGSRQTLVGGWFAMLVSGLTCIVLVILSLGK